MAERKNDDDHPCRFCGHELGRHDSISGCVECRCMATKGEARPRTTADMTAGKPIRREGDPIFTLEKSKIINPFRVIFAPGIAASEEEFVGHQNGSMNPWNGYATADEALTEAENLNRTSREQFQHWVAVEIKEIRRG